MAEMKDQEKKGAAQSKAIHGEAAVKTEQAKSDAIKKKPAVKTAKAPVKQAATKTAADKKAPEAKAAKAPVKQAASKTAAVKKVAAVKTEKPGTAAAKKKPTADKAKEPVKKAIKKPAAGKEETLEKTKQGMDGTAKKKPVTEESIPLAGKTGEKVKKAPGAFARKMEEVKGVATVIGQKIAEVAKEVVIKSEKLEDAIAVGLQEMKKDIHQVAENIADKTKEQPKT